MTHLEVVNVGTYPPPYGGVSIHLQRLHRRLVDAGVRSRLIDLSTGEKVLADGVVQRGWLATLYHLVRAAPSIVHLHYLMPRRLPLFALLASRHRLVLSLHNERFIDELAAEPALVRRAAVAALNRLHVIVVDSERCRELINGIVRDTARVVLIPEYLDPVDVPALRHPEVEALRSRHTFLLGSNAFRITFHKGVDLYGLDQLVELVHRLTNRRCLDVAMVFLLPEVGDAAYLERLRSRLTALGIAQRFLFVTQPLDEASSLWKVCDIVIRATTTDGNSLSVLEGLSAGIPVVASDCVPRPDGTVVFRTRDLDDLETTILGVLTHIGEQKARVAALGSMDNGHRFLDLYRSMGMTTEP